MTGTRWPGDRWQVGRHLGEVAGEEGAELHEGVVALVEQLAHQLQVVRLSLLANYFLTNIYSSK